MPPIARNYMQPPQPKLAIKAIHQSMGPNHNTLNVTVSDASKRQAAIEQCASGLSYDQAALALSRDGHMSYAKPLQISAPVMSQPVINPPANNGAMSSDITISTVISAMLKLKTEGKPVNRSTVLTTMNKPTGGAHWRQLTALWDTATAQFQAI